MKRGERAPSLQRSRVTLVIPTASIYNAQASSINIEIICEGLEKRKEEERTEDYVERFRMVASQSLAELIEKHSRSSHPLKSQLAYENKAGPMLIFPFITTLEN
ncbi:hypothetical protein CK203_047922 [Vitis vinifera]|uniref:Uncharacterized protein n=1 Tax=Vitis vinifera TaxID=29760 RepID=A0A438GR82_VITVI|nr:hypothetical protein CK203_047922 [Vitis vinifera]